MSTSFDAVILVLSLYKGMQFYGQVTASEGSSNIPQGMGARGVMRALRWRGKPGTLIDILLRDSMLFPIM